MQILEGIAAARTFISKEKTLKNQIGLVPTMGALHRGHLDLVSKSVSENEITIASIFVNPLQFNNANDLAKYPRTLEHDMQMLKGVGCDAVFVPPVDEMYKEPQTLSMNFAKLDTTLEGKFRPGHFSGVGIVVSKLFNIIQPNIAYFGQKDYQQFLIIKKLIRDLNFPIELVSVEIARDDDGLAMSSRNQRLTAEQRALAPILYQTLKNTSQLLLNTPLVNIKSDVSRKFDDLNIKLEYLELADRDNLNILEEYDPSTPSILLIAAYFGEVRLIDNLFI